MFNDIMQRLTIGRALILGFLLSATYYFMFYDSGSTQEAQITATIQERATLQTELNEIEKKIEMAKNFELASQTLGDSLQKLLSYIPAQFRIGQLLKMVSREARVSGLDIARMSQLTVSEPDKIQDFTELGATVEMTGDYNQVLAFMSSMTRQRQIFLFEKILITAGQEGTGGVSGLVKFTADIHAYSYNGTLTKGPAVQEDGQNGM